RGPDQQSGVMWGQATRNEVAALHHRDLFPSAVSRATEDPAIAGHGVPGRGFAHDMSDRLVPIWHRQRSNLAAAVVKDGEPVIQAQERADHPDHVPPGPEAASKGRSAGPGPATIRWRTNRTASRRTSAPSSSAEPSRSTALPIVTMARCTTLLATTSYSGRPCSARANSSKKRGRLGAISVASAEAASSSPAPSRTRAANWRD